MLTKKDVAELESAAAIYRPLQKPWTEAEKNIARKFYGRVPLELLAKKLGRSKKSVQQFLYR